MYSFTRRTHNVRAIMRRADLVLSRGCITEKQLLTLRLIFLVCGAANVGTMLTDTIHQSSPCTAITFSAVTYYFVLIYFATACSIHYWQRTLIARHAEYHISLLELSRDPGLGSTKLSKCEVCGKIAFVLTWVACIVNVTIMYLNHKYVLWDNGYGLACLCVICIETSLNRHTVDAHALLYALVFGTIYAGTVFCINLFDSCSASLIADLECAHSLNSTQQREWWQLHLLCDDYGLPWSQAAIFFGTMIVTSLCLWSVTSLRVQSLVHVSKTDGCIQ